jgi:hypothetical protein
MKIEGERFGREIEGWYKVILCPHCIRVEAVCTETGPTYYARTGVPSMGEHFCSVCGQLIGCFGLTPTPAPLTLYAVARFSRSSFWLASILYVLTMGGIDRRPYAWTLREGSAEQLLKAKVDGMAKL